MDKDKALDAALSQIEKAFGKGSIMRLGQDNAHADIEAISTGSLGLDLALGIGGMPRGRIVEIYGPESSGKTTLALSVIAQAQKKGGTCAFIDAEHALDPSYAKKIGVDIENLLISQPDAGEQALEITDTLVRSGAVDVLVVDSVAALVPKAELEGEMGDSHMGLQARLMSQALRKLTSTVSRSNTLIIFINQIRMKIGVMFGNPETTTGGNALKFYASVRIDIRSIGKIKDKEDIIGSQTRVKIDKNTRRMTAAFGMELDIFIMPTNVNVSVWRKDSCYRETAIRKTSACGINFNINAKLSRLSWEVADNHLDFATVLERFDRIRNTQPTRKWEVLFLTSLANASFCRLFGGDLVAMLIVFVSTLAGYRLKQIMLEEKCNMRLTFLCASFFSAALSAGGHIFNVGSTPEIALGTSVLYLIPGVLYINAVSDLIYRHYLCV